MDFLDNYVFGPLNIIDRAQGLLAGLFYGDLGHTFQVKYHDRGGKHTRKQIIGMLNTYGIAAFGHTHDADHMYFKVKRRQAAWAEYVMRSADVALVGEPFGEASFKAKPGKMPTPWASKKQAKRAAAWRGWL